MISKMWRGAVLLLVVVIACLAVAQTATDSGVPRLIKFNGILNSAASGTTVGVTFALYAEQTGGAPLWLETQNVAVDEKGRYTIYLGANHANGVPMDLFASGEARWLGVQPEGQAEQARVQLVSVPYALTAGDAQTLGGQPLSAFVLASAGNGSTTGGGTATTNASGGGVVALATPQTTPNVTTSGASLIIIWPSSPVRRTSRTRRWFMTRAQPWALGRRHRRRPSTWSRRALWRGLWMSTATR